MPDTIKKVGVQLTVKEISTQTAYAIMEHYGFDKMLGYMLPPFRIQELADCIIMEQIKLLFEETLPSKSMRAHLLEAGIADEADHVRHARLLQYAQHYRTSYYERIANERGQSPAELLPDDMSTIEQRLSGYRLNSMQFYALTAIDKCRIIKLIASGRVSKIKSVSNEVLRDSFKEYSDFVTGLKAAATDDEKLLFNTFALFNLEWNYGIALAYEAICQAEEQSGRDPFDAVKILALKGPLPTNDEPIWTDNRFVFHRRELIPLALDKDAAGEVSEKIAIYLRLKCEVGPRIIDYLRQETTIKDWADFVRSYYPLLESYPDFDWTKKRLYAYRKLADQMFEKVPPPKSKQK